MGMGDRIAKFDPSNPGEVIDSRGLDTGSDLVVWDAGMRIKDVLEVLQGGVEAAVGQLEARMDGSQPTVTVLLGTAASSELLAGLQLRQLPGATLADLRDWTGLNPPRFAINGAPGAGGTFLGAVFTGGLFYGGTPLVPAGAIPDLPEAVLVILLGTLAGGDVFSFDPGPDPGQLTLSMTRLPSLPVEPSASLTIGATSTLSILGPGSLQLQARTLIGGWLGVSPQPGSATGSPGVWPKTGDAEGVLYPVEPLSDPTTFGGLKTGIPGQIACLVNTSTTKRLALTGELPGAAGPEQIVGPEGETVMILPGEGVIAVQDRDSEVWYLPSLSRKLKVTPADTRPRDLRNKVTEGPGIGFEVVNAGGDELLKISATGAGSLTWQKFTIDYTAFTAALSSERVLLTTLPSKTALHAGLMKHSVAWRGGALTSATASLWYDAAPITTSPSLDVFDDPSSTGIQRTDNPPDGTQFYLSHFGAVDVEVDIGVVGGNVEDLEQGELEVWLCLGSLP